MKNGLYSIHVSLQDGRSGKGSGVVLFRDGKIVGGDAYLFYTGHYTANGDRFEGEAVVQRHTKSLDDNPMFDGPIPVRVRISGTCDTTSGVIYGTSLTAPASPVFSATLRKLADSG